MKEINQIGHRLLLQFESLAVSCILDGDPVLGLLLQHFINKPVQGEVAVFQLFRDTGGSIFVDDLFQGRAEVERTVQTKLVYYYRL